MSNYWNDILTEKLKENGFQITYEDIDQVSEEEYVQIRMQGFGASDSSKLLNCNPFPNGTRMDLCKEKATGVYDESIGKKASVRMGKDIEPIILNKAGSLISIDKGTGVVLKPSNMYGNTHHLNINYDGIWIDTEKEMRDPGDPLSFPIHTYKEGGNIFPIEAKAVTKYGRRHYDFTKAIYFQKDGEYHKRDQNPSKYIGPIRDISEYCIEAAKHYGIPVYYYTQIQQQMLGTDSDGYLAVMDVDNWDVHVFKIYQDEYVQSELKRLGDVGWSIVEIQKEKEAK